MIWLSYRLQLLPLQQCRQFLTNAEWQYAQTLSQKRALQFSNGRALTRQLLQRYHSYDLVEVAIELPADKAPTLIVGQQIWQLSISHSGQAIAVAVSKTHRLGLDIEQIKPRKFESFKAEYLALANVENLTGFYQSWTAAEAYSKLTAIPLLEVLQQSLAKDMQYKYLFLSEYMLCLCSKQDNILYIIDEVSL